MRNWMREIILKDKFEITTFLDIKQEEFSHYCAFYSNDRELDTNKAQFFLFGFHP